MGNSLRCCISCILPCGALDVIRIVHSSGHVEEVTGTIFAGDVMKANPKHVVRKHCPEGVRVIVLPPDAPLKRGHIYFLCPLVSNSSSSSPSAKSGTPRKKIPRKDFHREPPSDPKPTTHDSRASPNDRYLTEVVSERMCTLSRSRRRGRVGIWRPHLRSISEDLSYCA